MHRAVFPILRCFRIYLLRKKVRVKKKKKKSPCGSISPSHPVGLRMENGSPSQLKKLPARAADTTTQWPLPIWTDAKYDAQAERHVPPANRSKHAIPYSQPSSSVYIYYMHILTTQLIYKKAASKMSKNKNIFFRTPTPSLPCSRVRKEGCKKNHFTFVQEMLHPLRNLHQAGETATTQQLAVGKKPREGEKEASKECQ